MTLKKRKFGIILAAGLGTRLRDIDNGDTIKPLVPLNGLTLLLRTIYSHEVASRDHVIIVLGWESEVIKKNIISEYKGPVKLEFAYNDRYQLQNGISLLCAKPFVEKEFILTMADHVLDDKIMQLADGHSPPIGGAALCVDYKLDSILDMDDATKVIEKDGFITNIGKNIEGFNCVDTGVFIGTSGLMDAIDQVYEQNGDASLSDGVLRLAKEGNMEVLDIQDAFWQDVDTPEMLEHAERRLSLQSEKK